MSMVRKIDKESGSSFIIETIDDSTCVVKENRVDELKAKVKDLMDEAMGGEELDQDKDSGMLFPRHDALLMLSDLETGK